MVDPVDSTLLELLVRFSPFDMIEEDLLIILAKEIDIKVATKDFILFENGGFDADEYYLIEGSIVLQAHDGRESIIEAGQPNARYPIARLRPRMYTAKAASDIQYFVINASVLGELQRSVRENNSEIVIQGRRLRAKNEGHALIYEFQQELKNGSFVLPSLPEVALKIRELAENEDVELADLAKMVNTDPAIAAKLIKVANSAFYTGVKPCNDTLAAISRLGLITTKQLVTSFAILALFKTKSDLFKDRMKALWSVSVEVAAYCYVLAKHLQNFNEEEALLAGLIHSIGEIAALTYAERFLGLPKNENILNTTTTTLRGPIGEMILSNWGFSDRLVTVAREWSNWTRESETELDYCDLVQIALLYTFQNNHNENPQPELTTVTAFKKLDNQQLSPELITQIIDQAKEQIDELHTLIG